MSEMIKESIWEKAREALSRFMFDGYSPVERERDYETIMAAIDAGEKAERADAQTADWMARSTSQKIHDLRKRIQDLEAKQMQDWLDRLF